MAEKENFLDYSGLEFYNNLLNKRNRRRLKYKGDILLNKDTRTDWNDLVKKGFASIGDTYHISGDDGDMVEIDDIKYRVGDFIIVTNRITSEVDTATGDTKFYDEDGNESNVEVIKFGGSNSDFCLTKVELKQWVKEGVGDVLDSNPTTDTATDGTDGGVGVDGNVVDLDNVGENPPYIPIDKGEYYFKFTLHDRNELEEDEFLYCSVKDLYNPPIICVDELPTSDIKYDTFYELSPRAKLHYYLQNSFVVSNGYKLKEDGIYSIDATDPTILTLEEKFSDINIGTLDAKYIDNTADLNTANSDDVIISYSKLDEDGYRYYYCRETEFLNFKNHDARVRTEMYFYSEKESAWKKIYNQGGIVVVSNLPTGDNIDSSSIYEVKEVKEIKYNIEYEFYNRQDGAYSFLYDGIVDNTNGNYVFKYVDGIGATDVLPYTTETKPNDVEEHDTICYVQKIVDNEQDGDPFYIRKDRIFWDCDDAVDYSPTEFYIYEEENSVWHKIFPNVSIVTVDELPTKDIVVDSFYRLNPKGESHYEIKNAYKIKEGTGYGFYSDSIYRFGTTVIRFEDIKSATDIQDMVNEYDINSHDVINFADVLYHIQKIQDGNVLKDIYCLKITYQNEYENVIEPSRQYQELYLFDNVNNKWNKIYYQNTFEIVDTLPDANSLIEDKVYWLKEDVTETNATTGDTVTTKAGVYKFDFNSKQFYLYREYDETNLDVDYLFDSTLTSAYDGDADKVVTSKYLDDTLKDYTRYLNPFYNINKKEFATKADLDAFDLDTLDDGTVTLMYVKNDETYAPTDPAIKSPMTIYSCVAVNKNADGVPTRKLDFIGEYKNADFAVSKVELKIWMNGYYNIDGDVIDLGDTTPDEPNHDDVTPPYYPIDTNERYLEITLKDRNGFEKDELIYCSLKNIFDYENQDLELKSFFEEVDPTDIGYTGNQEKVVSSEYLHDQLENLTAIIQEELDDIYDVASKAKYIILDTKDDLDDYDLTTLDENSFNIFLVVKDTEIDHYEASGVEITVEDYNADKDTYDADNTLKAFYKHVSSSSEYNYAYIVDGTQTPQISDVEFDSTLYACAVFDDDGYPIKEREVKYVGNLNFNENSFEQYFRKKHYQKINVGDEYYVDGTTYEVVEDKTIDIDNTTQIKKSDVIMKYGTSISIGDFVDKVIATEEMIGNKCIFIKRNEISVPVIQYINKAIHTFTDPDALENDVKVDYLSYLGKEIMYREFENKNIEFENADDYNGLVAGTVYVP